MTRRPNKGATTQKAPKRKEKSKENLGNYPILDKFNTVEDVRAYLGGELIVCLRCGKKMKALATHLVRVHGETPDSYREFYGIPWSYGLVPLAVKRRIAVAQRKRWDDGSSPILNYQDGSSRSQASSTARREKCAAVKALAGQYLDSIPAVDCVCSCGKTFVREPHHTRQTLCLECMILKNPRRYIKEVETTCDRCGVTVFRGPTCKKTTCSGCLKIAKRARKNERRRTGRPTGYHGHKKNNPF
jgi:adenine-specific DNA methylase